MVSLFKTPKAPKPLDPAKVASQQLDQNRQGIQQQAAANRLNQTDAFGTSLTYRQTGTDAQGNPIYSANQSLGKLGQQYSGGLASLGRQYFQTAGQTGDLGSGAAFDRAYDFATANLEPRFERVRAGADARLINQGLQPGSEAYKNAMGDLALQQNEARNNLVAGLQGQMFNQGLQQRQQTMGELNPGLQFGQQVLNPSYINVPGVNVPQVDMSQLAGLQYKGQMANYDAEMQNRSGLLGGLASIGGTLAGAAFGGLPGAAIGQKLGGAFG